MPAPTPDVPHPAHPGPTSGAVGSGEPVATEPTDVAGLVDAAVALAEHWMGATAAGETEEERAASERLAALVGDPDGLDLAVRFVDRVARPEDQRVAARELAAISARSAGGFLSGSDRLLLGLGSTAARLVPAVVVPLARRRLRQLVGHLVVDAHDPAMGERLAQARRDGVRLNINLLGEAVLGEAEAAARAARTVALLERPDVDHVSVKVSALVSQISTWDTEGTVARVLERLRPLFRAAVSRSPHAFVNLDMEEHRDLDLTIEAFTSLLAEPEFHRLEAGIALQAYLPDSVEALERLVAFAAERAAGGGAAVKVRVVKGANLSMERVEAELHGWEQAPYGTKAEVDANFLRLVERVLRPELGGAMRLGLASHNLYDVALGHLLAQARGVSASLDVEMLQGMAPAQARAVRSTVGGLLLYTPVVARDDFDVAVSYLVRRLEENAQPQNFLHALFTDKTVGTVGPGAGTGAGETVGTETHGTDEPEHDETEPQHDETGTETDEPDSGGGAAVGTAAGGAVVGGQSTSGMAGQEARFRASVDAMDTTSRSRRRSPVRGPSPTTFANTPDSDPALGEVRAWAAACVAAPAPAPSSAVLASMSAVDAVVAAAVVAQPVWATRSAVERAAVLRRAAEELEARRSELVAVMAAEGGKTVAEADPEVSEAVDFARYYADRVLELEPAEGHLGTDGARFTSTAVTLVAPPWNFPVAIPCGSVLAALAAGSAVVIKPAPQTPACAEVAMAAIQAALADGGAPPDLLQVVRTDEGVVGRALVSHPDVGTVLLTGSIETARLFAGWRAEHPGGPQVFAETSGKNAIVVTPWADFDLAVADVVRSAFGHAGQKCSAASLVVLVGSAGRSERLLRQLVDAVSSVRVGWPTSLGATMGPLIEPPTGKLARALTTLEPGESWLVRPEQLDDTGRLWSPGLKDGVAPGSPFHVTECFGPVLGIMRADTLDQALELQNGTPFGLTGGLHSLDDADGGEVERWLDAVEVGNAYVNRHTTGAIVRRQPFGGWKGSVVGPGAKAGGPDYVAQLGTWAPHGLPTRLANPPAHVRRALTDLAKVVVDEDEAAWLAAAVGSDAAAWADELGLEVDATGLSVEQNLLRHRPLPTITVRAGAGARPVELIRLLLAAELVGTTVRASLDPSLVPALSGGPLATDRRLAAVVDAVERADLFVSRARSGAVTGRVRVVGDEGATLPGRLAATDLTVLSGPVLATGRRELLTFLRPQAISRTLHRYGHLPRR